MISAARSRVAGIFAPAIAVLAIGLAGALSQAVTQEALAQEQSGQRDDGLIRSDQLDRGALLFYTDEPGLYVPAPLLATKIDISVAGAIARTVVTQRFKNPAEVYVEGKYLFPLPEGAAVDTLKMRVDDRLIEGEIKEREEAKEIYEEAKAEGYVASLVEQERPNMFTTSVANIAPDATVVIQIEFQESLLVRDGVFGMRVPLVVAPRYSPDPRPLLVKFGADGWEVDASDPVADRERITAPVADPAAEDPNTIRNPVELTVDLEAGFPLGHIKSLYHEIAVTPRGAEGAEIALDGVVPADRDFYLSWAPQEISEPDLALFTELSEDEEHYLLMLTPPSAEAIGDTRRPREVIFVQDISGSMFGESIEQARKGLEMALKRLKPEDTFNVIVFNDRFGLFADAPLPATEENVKNAVEAVRALEADGGTEMLPALQAALKDDREAEDERVRQVIFLTDGAVGNEREMLKLIKTDLGRSRLFTVGIGSAPNSYFMTAAAEAGRGTHVFIGDLSEVQERMEQLFARIETPAMTEMSLRVDGFQDAEAWPNPLPDLYAGDPIVATIRIDTNRPTRAIPAVVVRGVRAGEPWEKTIRLDAAEARPGVSKLWARHRIRALESLRLSPDVDQDAAEKIDAEILRTALDHHLVSRLSSLVAVDVTPTRPQGEETVTKDVPLNLPAGWDADAFFGREQAEPAPVRKAALQQGQLARLQAAASLRTTLDPSAPPPPVGSLDWAGLALVGLFMALLGALLLMITQQGRRRARQG